MKVWQCAVWCVVVSVLMFSVMGVTGQEDAHNTSNTNMANVTVAPHAATTQHSGEHTDGEDHDDTGASSEPEPEPETEPEPKPTTAAGKGDSGAGTMAASIPAMLGGLLVALRLHL